MKKIAVMPNNDKDLGLFNTKRLMGLLSNKAEIYMDESYSVLGMNVNYTIMQTMQQSWAATVQYCAVRRNVLNEKYPCLELILVK